MQMQSLNTFLAASLLAVSLNASADSFVLRSATITANGKLPSAQVFNGFGCSGPNISPALSWQHAPDGTKSFAVSVYDPDAPTGSGWWHWLVVNLPANTSSLAEGAGAPSSKLLPAGAAQVRSDYGQPAFGGACPPAGDQPHRYIFTVYALKTERLELPENATAALAGFMIHANTIGQASFSATYGR